MSAVFLKILNMAIAAGWLILAVLVLRLLLRKAPKWIICLLWAVAAVRLICPFSFESILSLIPNSETVPENIGLMPQPAVDTGIPAINEAVNPVITDSFAPDPQMVTSVNPLQAAVGIASFVWVIGIAAMLLYALISYLKLKKTVAAAVPAGEGVMACDELRSPFILGLIKPVIYVPSSMDGQTLEYVLDHEKAHLKRRDHLWKPLGFLLLAVYWFNPLCWIAYILLCRDIEAACDEKVIRFMDRDAVAAYSQALLDCSFPRRRIAACPLAFGEVGVKERVKSVLNYKKPAFWIILLAVIACIAVAVCFLTNPKKEEPSPFTPRTFTATVTRIESSLFYVRPDNGMPELLSSKCFEVPMDKLSQAEDIQLTIGDHVEISYNGEVLEVSPARLGKVDQVKVILREVSELKFENEHAFYFSKDPITGTNDFLPNTLLYPYVFFNRRGSGDYSGEWHTCRDVGISFGLSGMYTVNGDRIRAVEGGGIVPLHEDRFIEFRILSETEIMVMKIADGLFSAYGAEPWLAEGDILAWSGRDYPEEEVIPAGEQTDEIDLAILRERCPEYFDLPVENGLEVVICKFSEGSDSYRCVILPAAERTREELLLEVLEFRYSCSMDEMRQILSTYDIPEEMIKVTPYQHPVSSYYWPDAALEGEAERLKSMLLGDR